MENTAEKQKMKAWKKALITVIVLLLALLIGLGAAAGVLWSMITNADNKGKISEKPSTDIFEPMIKSVVFGEEQKITDEEINGIIAYIIDITEQTQEDEEPGQVAVKAANMYLHNGEEDNEIFVLVDYKGVEMILSADISISLDSDKKEISLKLDDCHIGTLPVDPAVALRILENHEAFDSVSESIKIDGTSIIIPSAYSFDIMDYSFPIEITKLKTGEGSANVQTTSALDTIVDMLGEYLLTLLE